MRVAVISCWKYRDAWKPFMALARHFWPEVSPDLYSDSVGESWCSVLVRAAAEYQEPVTVMQEDFFINAPVRHDMVERAVELVNGGAGCVRLYPCPGSDSESGDPYFGAVSYEADYRISCQAAVWNPAYLRLIAQHAAGSAADFEIKGTELSRRLLSPILAFKRHIEPWPIQYICSAISRGKWNPDAKILCDKYGIEVDWTMRPMAA